MFKNIAFTVGIAALTTLGGNAMLSGIANAAEPIAVSAPTGNSQAPIALSADARHYATVTTDNTIEVRDRGLALDAAPEESLSGHKSRILALAFSRDGSYLATADDDRIVDIWSVKSGKVVRAIHEPGVSKDHIAADAQSAVTSLAFNALGTELVIVDNGYHTIGRYRGTEPSKLSYLDAFYTNSPLVSVASDGQGAWVAGDSGGALHFFDSELKEIGSTTSKMASSVRALAVSTDSAYLATGGDDNEVKVWNFGGSAAAARMAANFTLARRYPIGVPVTSLVFRSDWKTILYTDNAHHLNEWTYVDTLGDRSATGQIATSATSAEVVPAAETPVTPVTPTTSVAVAAVAPTNAAAPKPIVIAAAKPTGKTAAAPATRTGTASAASLPPPMRYQLVVKQTNKLVGHSDYINDVTFSPDGRTLASASRDRTVRLWDVADGTQETILGKHSAYVSAVAFSPNGRTLASGGWDDQIKLFDVASQSENATDQRFAKHGSYVLSLDFSPDGSHLVSGSNDRTARLFNVGTGASRGTIPMPDGVSSVAFSPDGTRIAGGCLDGSVYLWDTATMHRLRAFRPTAAAHPIFCITFLDNNTIAAGGKGGTLNVWSVQTGLLATLPAGGQDIFGLAFDGPRQILAAGGADRKIRLWPAETLRKARNGAHIAPTLTLAGHANTVRSLAFSADGTMLASGGWDYNILLWSVAEKPDMSADAATGLPTRMASR